MKRAIILLFLFSLLNAKIITQCLFSEGEGINKKEAVKNALILAVSQYKGINIKQIELLKNRINNLSVDDKDVSVMQNSYENEIVTATEGFVRSFRIEKTKRTDNGYKVLLKVCFKGYKYTGNAPNHRRSIAVFPFLGDNNLVFTKYVIEYLSQSRKFNVIDRSDDTYLDIENLLWLKPTTDKNEIIKIGKRLGSDYILVGKIDIKKHTDYQKMPLLDKYEKKEYFLVKVDFKILDSVTGAVKWADSIELKGNDLDIIYKTLAKKLTEKMFYNIYPPKIVNVEGKYITINYGGNLFKTGDVLFIYSANKPVYDPYTKEFLGYEEKKVGVAKIIRVAPKFSQAIYKGRVKTGYILRKVEP